MSNRRPFVLCTVCRVLEDLVALVRLGLTSRAQLAAENLFLRKPLALVITGETAHRFLVHDRDAIYAPCFDRAVAAMGLRVLKTPSGRRRPMPSVNG
jgi:hypothetical protein